MKSLFVLAISLIFSNYGVSQAIPADSLFLGQKLPGDKPEKFSLKVDSGYFAAERVAITRDGKEIYYSQIKGYYPDTGLSVKRYTFENGRWEGPFVVFEGYAAPALSLSEDTIYVEYNFETFMSERKGKEWSAPKRILRQIDSAHYYQCTGNGSYYVSARTSTGAGLADWCRVKTEAKDTSAYSLGQPLNCAGNNLDFFISADESFMIVTNRPRFGISFKKSDGTWSEPKSFGPVIDFGLNSWGPFVTNDNKFLFYTTGTKPDYSDVQVYWVRIDRIIDSLGVVQP